MFHASPNICATSTPRARSSRCGRYVDATCIAAVHWSRSSTSSHLLGRQTHTCSQSIAPRDMISPRNPRRLYVERVAWSAKRTPHMHAGECVASHVFTNAHVHRSPRRPRKSRHTRGKHGKNGVTAVQHKTVPVPDLIRET